MCRGIECSVQNFLRSSRVMFLYPCIPSSIASAVTFPNHLFSRYSVVVESLPPLLPTIILSPLLIRLYFFIVVKTVFSKCCMKCFLHRFFSAVIAAFLLHLLHFAMFFLGGGNNAYILVAFFLFCMSHHTIESQVAYALVEDALKRWERRAYERADAKRSELARQHAVMIDAIASGVRRAAYVCGGVGGGFVAGSLLSSVLDMPVVLTDISLMLVGGVVGNIAASKDYLGYRFSEFLLLRRKIMDLEFQLRDIESSADYQRAVKKIEGKLLVL